MITLPRIPAAILLACACFGVPAVWADDADKVDPRVKAVDAQIATARKTVDVELEKAKEKVAVEYKKNCTAQAKVLESAVKNCERKIGVAKSMSDKKSVEALEARLVDLKDELAGWKANADKKWVVVLEEAEEVKGEVKLEKIRSARQVLGDWSYSGYVVRVKEGGVCEWVGVRNDKWEIVKGELVISGGTKARLALRGGALVDAESGREVAARPSKK